MVFVSFCSAIVCLLVALIDFVVGVAVVEHAVVTSHFVAVFHGQRLIVVFVSAVDADEVVLVIVVDGVIVVGRVFVS